MTITSSRATIFRRELTKVFSGAGPHSIRKLGMIFGPDRRFLINYIAQLASRCWLQFKGINDGTDGTAENLGC